MSPEQIDKVVNIVELGIADALQANMLRKVPHGYCFYCDTEMEVYDVISSPSVQAQPPICHECIICMAVAMFQQDGL